MHIYERKGKQIDKLKSHDGKNFDELIWKSNYLVHRLEKQLFPRHMWVHAPF